MKNFVLENFKVEFLDINAVMEGFQNIKDG